VYHKMLRVSVQGFKAVVVMAEFGPNQVLRRIQGRSSKEPSRSSICVGAIHVLDRFGSYMNHSCNPSARVDDGYIKTNWELNPGAEVTIDYRKTEDRLVYPFTCLQCGTRIAGTDSVCIRSASAWGASF
jgi:hypothetical protein